MNSSVAIGFSNDRQILSAVVMILVVQTFGAVLAASCLGKDQPAPEEAIYRNNIGKVNGRLPGFEGL